jgi:hypothetical protein
MTYASGGIRVGTSDTGRVKVGYVRVFFSLAGGVNRPELGKATRMEQGMANLNSCLHTVRK